MSHGSHCECVACRMGRAVGMIRSMPIIANAKRRLGSKRVMSKKNKLIELWKTNCSDCEAAKPIVAELEEEGFEFEKHNIADEDGQKLWDKYAAAIDTYSKSQGWEEGFIYTPTFINPQNERILAFADRSPRKNELIKFAEGSLS